jgi:hypothetical protein
MPEATQTQLDKIQQVIDQFDGNMYEKYSGRGMYGTNCIGISLDQYTSVDDVVEFAANIGLRGIRWDNLGLGSIVYWPHISID